MYEGDGDSDREQDLLQTWLGELDTLKKVNIHLQTWLGELDALKKNILLYIDLTRRTRLLKGYILNTL